MVDEPAWGDLAGAGKTCASRIVREDTWIGLEPNAQVWVGKVDAAVNAGPHARYALDPAEYPILAARPVPQIMLCVPDFGRTWQTSQCLPINLLKLWKMRHFVTFVLADLNAEFSQEMKDLLHKCRAAVACGFLRHFRRQVPAEDGFTHWHASIGKNSAHACAAVVSKNSVLVELDCDNFVSDEFMFNLIENGDELLQGEIAGLAWKHPQCPANTGRTHVLVACPRGFSECVGGFSPRVLSKVVRVPSCFTWKLVSWFS